VKDGRFKTIGTWIAGLVGIAAIVLAILWMSGAFTPGRIDPGILPPPAGLPQPKSVATVASQTVPEWYEAVGTVRSAVEARIAPQVTGRIIDIAVEEGSAVSKGDIIASLDDEAFRARLEQARSGVRSAEATFEQAASSHARIRQLIAKEAATTEQLEAAAALEKQADAAVESARQKLEEARVALGYTRIASPLSGVVARRESDSGDLAWPGRTLVVVHDPSRLRLEASVREGLIGGVAVGRTVEIWITALSKTLPGSIDEIVPSGDPVSRSFVVKASLPAEAVADVYPGMFGKLRLRTGERQAMMVPADAVTTVGQLDTLLVKQGERWLRRYVTVGERRGDEIEILSGLSGGETIGLAGGDDRVDE